MNLNEALSAFIFLPIRTLTTVADIKTSKKAVFVLSIDEVTKITVSFTDFTATTVGDCGLGKYDLRTAFPGAIVTIIKDNILISRAKLDNFNPSLRVFGV